MSVTVYYATFRDDIIVGAGAKEDRQFMDDVITFRPRASRPLSAEVERQLERFVDSIDRKSARRSLIYGVEDVYPRPPIFPPPKE